jgi:hypothetical protein
MKTMLNTPRIAFSYRPRIQIHATKEVHVEPVACCVAVVVTRRVQKTTKLEVNQVWQSVDTLRMSIVGPNDVEVLCES